MFRIALTAPNLKLIYYMCNSKLTTLIYVLQSIGRGFWLTLPHEYTCLIPPLTHSHINTPFTTFLFVCFSNIFLVKYTTVRKVSNFRLPLFPRKCSLNILDDWIRLQFTKVIFSKNHKQKISHEFLFESFFLDLSVLHGHSFFHPHHNDLRLRRISIPDLIHYIFFPILIHDKEPPISLLSAK